MSIRLTPYILLRRETKPVASHIPCPTGKAGGKARKEERGKPQCQGKASRAARGAWRAAREEGGGTGQGKAEKHRGSPRHKDLTLS